MWSFLLGLGTMVAFLVAIGITRGRGMDARRWSTTWAVTSAIFAAGMVLAYLARAAWLVEPFYGAAVGYVASVSAHTLHHALHPAPNGEARGAARARRGGTP
jgi:multisubunit Na+/H+ antiporter MnhG subunit